MTKPCHCCHGSGKECKTTDFGKSLRKWRLKAKLSQNLVAKELGITSAFLCMIEAGRRQPNEAVIYAAGRLIEVVK